MGPQLQEVKSQRERCRAALSTTKGNSRSPRQNRRIVVEKNAAPGRGVTSENPCRERISAASAAASGPLDRGMKAVVAQAKRLGISAFATRKSAKRRTRTKGSSMVAAALAADSNRNLVNPA